MTDRKPYEPPAIERSDKFGEPKPFEERLALLLERGGDGGLVLHKTTSCFVVSWQSPGAGDVRPGGRRPSSWPFVVGATLSEAVDRALEHLS